MPPISAILGISRAPFLLLPIVLTAAGAAAAAFDGAFDWARTIAAGLGLVALHIAVNALNEASDMQSGIDLQTQRTPFSGGSGTLPSGAVTVRFARNYGLAMLGFGLAIGAWLVAQTGWPLVVVVLLGAFSILAYTNLLLRTGLGELFAGLGLGGLPIVGVALVQGGEISPAAWAVAIPATLMTFNLLLLNEFPDETADRAGGRRHLVILLGRGGAAAIYLAAAALVPLSLGAAVWLGALPALALGAALPTLLLLPVVAWAIGGTARPVPIPALAMNVAWNLLTNATLAVLLVMSAAPSAS